MNTLTYKTSSRPVMTSLQRAVYVVLLLGSISLITIFGLWWFSPSHIPMNFGGRLHVLDILFFCLLSYVVWYQIANEMFAWYIAGFMKRPEHVEPEENLKVAFLTAFVPGSEPIEILEKTLTAMVKADYEHETWLLDEGNDPEAIRICKRLGVNHFTRKGIEKYNMSHGPYKAKTKGGNYNSWFNEHGDKYDIVAQLDVDFIPKKNYLTRTLGYFRDPNVAFVGTPQIYGNTKDSWIVKGAAEQAYNFYGAMQKGLYGMGMQLFIGANHVFRVSAHNAIEGYSGHIVEDHLTGMKLYAKKWKSVYVPEILAIGEGPTTWDAYFSQQMRWAYGLIDILFRHSPRIMPEMKTTHKINYFLLQQYYFYGLAQFIGIVLLGLYFFFGLQSTSMELKPLLELYLPLLVMQQIFFLWLQRFNIDPKEESGLMLRGKILNMAAWPIYLVALVGAIVGKKLTYVVTPKGKNQNSTVNLSLFIPHIILGTLTFVDIVVSKITGHHAVQLMFWAVLNTIVMAGFIFSEVFKLILEKVSRMTNGNKLTNEAASLG